jgi:hypothetical protein
MFRRNEWVVIVDRRPRMNGVQAVATAAFIIALVIAGPSLIKAAGQDMRVAQADSRSISNADLCTAERIEAGMCAPSLFQPTSMVRLSSAGFCQRENGRLNCTTCVPSSDGTGMTCRKDGD